MAKLVGPLRLKGSVEGLNFRVMKDGECIVGAKPGPSSKMVKEHQRFQRTRENSKEFVRAQAAATLLRRALMPEWKLAAGINSFRKLHAIMVRVLQKDTVSVRGERMVTPRALKLLEGFDVNEKVPFTAAFKVPLNCTIERGTGEMVLNLPSFIPSARIMQHAGATHARLMIKGFALNFDSNEILHSATETMLIPITDDETETGSLQVTVAAEQGMSMFLCAGLSYWRNDRLGDLMPCAENGNNALTLLSIDAGEAL